MGEKGPRERDLKQSTAYGARSLKDHCLIDQRSTFDYGVVKRGLEGAPVSLPLL